MASLNKVFLMGNLTKDPELRYTPNGSAVTDFGLAINRTYTSNGEKKEETCFVDINVWGKQAESTSKYLHKGSPAFIEGRLQLDQWEDKETGRARSRLRVVAERIQFLGSPKGGGAFDEKNAVGGNSFSDTGAYMPPPSAATPPQQQQYQQTAAPNVPPPSMPAPATNASTAGNAFTSPQSGSVLQQQPVGPVGETTPQQQPPQEPSPQQQQANAPQMPNAAFNPATETEDDIPF